MGIIAISVSAMCARGDVFDMPAGLTSLQFVQVGNAGNGGALSGAGAGGSGPDVVCGAVAYDFQIGKFEVTAAQYVEFLNAVGKTDTYGLYNVFNMPTSTYPFGCNILRGGTSGNYRYVVETDWANRPVNFVSWGDAARFCNWLTNGQPAGNQDLSSTEDGSYYLNGAISDSQLLSVTRKPGARYVLPTEDEWYKSAYHKNDGITANFWKYAAASDTAPSNVLSDPDGGNNANFYDNGYTIGPDYYRTTVGAFDNSVGPYGTFDQGGNVFEWDEAILLGNARGLRGGSFGTAIDRVRASDRSYRGAPTIDDDVIGFRVAMVPEPQCLLVLASLGYGLTTLRIRRISTSPAR